jgi:hypothetical protein
MAFENLFIRTKRSIGSIELDAILSEAHSNRVSLSTNPIELGAEVTDNATIEPKRLKLVAQVTDTPLGLASIGQIIDSVTGLFGSATSKNLTRSASAYNAMVQLMELREPLQIQTKLKLYENMIITDLSTSQDKNTANVVLMNITLDEALIVESEVIKLNPEQLLAGSPRQQASSADRKGREEALDPSDTTKKSALKAITDWITD